MGIYLNPNNDNFKSMLKAPIYVDKTMMIAETNRFIDVDNKYICISRPRRFGKTIAGNMLAAYYSKGCDSHELFAPYKIAADPSFEEKLNQYNVIKIDVNSEYQNIENKDLLLKTLIRKIKAELQTQFSDIMFSDDDSLADYLLRIHTEADETFIIIMDEYDVLVREKVSPELFAEYLSFLNGLFKSDTLRPAISLAYLTGILPIVRDKIQSKLNNFQEYTILDADCLAEFVGFTSEEVQQLCEKYDMDYAECKHWYDGYRQYGYEIYNPESVVRSMLKRRYANYWSRTSSYQAISDRIRHNFAGTRDDVVKMLAGESVYVDQGRFLNTLNDFRTRDDVLTYLIYLGYLAYDMDEETCRIPNKEIQQEWQRAIADDDDYAVTNEIIEASRDLLADTLNGDAKAVEKALDKSHIHVTSNRSYNHEDVLQSAIYLSYIYALNKYTVVKEMTAGKGFADIVYIPFAPDIPAMIIELKRNKSAKSAIDQIRKKQYFESLHLYSGKILFVGINYDEDEKTHECRIEEFEKRYTKADCALGF